MQHGLFSKRLLDETRAEYQQHSGKFIKRQIKVAAEGVENKNQADYLKMINCDMTEGYLFSKPIDLNEFLNQL